MPPTTDNQLVQQARAGEFQAFELLVSRHEGPLYAAAWHLTHNHHDAQDVVQNTFLSAMEHLGSFREESSFATWITRIALNFALKVLRSRKQRATVPLEAPDGEGQTVPVPEYIADWTTDPARTVQRRELRAILDEAVAQLPEGQRLVFVLRDVQGLSVRETAQALDLTEGNVKVRLLRARLALREVLTRRFGDPATRRQPHVHDHASAEDKT
ncbi:MAG: sigma-70 family RNA polymerase sigma factor [Planctomycetota bacterium]|nr:sigma-70 family RNA polymerase sigma factor [Planctomycetota bacterium]